MQLPGSVRRISRGLALAVLTALLPGLAACPVSNPRRELEPELCLDVGGALPDYGGNLPPVGPGTQRPLLKLTLRGPESHCNDGTPAVAFVRPAPQGSPDADRWIIHFDGGGACADPDTCLERFCSLGASPAVFEKAGKMSSLGQPDAIDHTRGLFALNPANDFAGYNHVHLAYCSSDSYSGSAAPKLVTATAAGVDYEIEFRGEAIVNDLIDTLRDGPTWADPRGAQSWYAEPLPDLDDAGLVLLSGDSAGGTGMRHHLDRLADELAATNRNPGGVEVLGVVDAGLAPALYEPGIGWNAASPASYAELGETYTRPRSRDFWETDDSSLDASCMASGVEDYYCMDTVYTLLNEITTPVFVRTDLQDPLAMGRIVGEWALLADPDAYARATVAEFAKLPAGSGQFATSCRAHVMELGVGFGSTTTDGGTGLTWHDLLSNWVDGFGPTIDLQQDWSGGATYTPSINCP